MLPDICFASRHPIKELTKRLTRIASDSATDEDWRFDGLPDLEGILPTLQTNQEEETKEHFFKTTNGGESISIESPLYCAFSRIDGEENKVFATEAEAQEGG